MVLYMGRGVTPGKQNKLSFRDRSVNCRRRGFEVREESEKASVLGAAAGAAVCLAGVRAWGLMQVCKYAGMQACGRRRRV